MATEDEVWVSHARNGGVSIVDKRSLRDARISLPGAEIWKLASDFSFVYGGGRVEGSADDGLLIKINPLSRQETGRVLLPEMIREVATDGIFVFAVGETGTIWIVSATDMKLLRTVKPTTLGASYAPTSVLVVEDLLVISARQFFGLDGAEIKDRRGKADENGAILLFANIVPDGRLRNDATADAHEPPVAKHLFSSGPVANWRWQPAEPARSKMLVRRPFLSWRYRAAAMFATYPASMAARSVQPAMDSPLRCLRIPVSFTTAIPGSKSAWPTALSATSGAGGTCAKPQTPVAGTTGACARSTTGSRPNGNSGAATSPKTDEIDLAISMIDLFWQDRQRGKHRKWHGTPLPASSPRL